jgi:3-oxoacyl-[acyl-carrier-protein] synthase II
LFETLHEVSANPLEPEELSSSEFLQREIPAFFGLSTLNSNACAHISASFDLAGAMGAYSTFADAAFQALIDAAGSVIQGENTVALVGGVSAKVNPQLLLQYEFWGWDKSFARTPAEASSFVVVRENNICVDKQFPAIKPASVYLSGFARGFIGSVTDKSKIYQQVFMQALYKASISAADIDWFLPYATHNEDANILLSLGAKESLPVLTSEASIGFAGAAGPMINLNLALFGLQQQKYLYNVNNSTGTNSLDKTRIQEKAGAMRHVALSVAGPEGQYVVVILSREVV